MQRATVLDRQQESQEGISDSRLACAQLGLAGQAKTALYEEKAGEGLNETNEAPPLP